ncbi:oxidoreductase [Halolactibacillus miurensis]|uniref:Oxidoreductase n=1 Tax=Halolactibacillus miurensis TaxID=306541 RepID=A0A1I6P1T1_9BACI|nr:MULTISPECIES: Gfo/Idh/MocA family oxidoreductase [Halolactibacillus]GEM03178.1 oxidoreductase [Halolactibacillus miurensis]SFS34152.1 Predicted dehydrogenase [Halolactibacillus miurensis]
MKKIHVAIIGCGNIFPMHAQSIIENDSTDLVAVCDIKPERAEARAKELGCQAYTDYMQLFDEQALDAIHICLPHYLHAPVSIEATKRGLHVLTEKPMAIDYQDAVDMLETAKEAGTHFGVIFQNRYNAGVQLIKRLLTDGTLGKIKSAKASVTWDRSDDYYAKSDWKGTWDKEGGGVLIDQAIHTLDLLRFFVDADIEYIDATISNRGHEQIEVEDAAEGIVKFKTGTVAAFHTINYYGYDASVEVELYCERGLVKMVGDKGTVDLFDGRTFIADNDPNETFSYGESVKSYWGVNHVKQINNFYDVLVNGGELYIKPEEALKTQKMINAIYQSGKEKQRIWFD